MYFNRKIILLRTFFYIQISPKWEEKVKKIEWRKQSAICNARSFLHLFSLHLRDHKSMFHYSKESLRIDDQVPRFLVSFHRKASTLLWPYQYISVLILTMVSKSSVVRISKFMRGERTGEEGTMIHQKLGFCIAKAALPNPQFSLRIWLPNVP